MDVNQDYGEFDGPMVDKDRESCYCRGRGIVQVSAQRLITGLPTVVSWVPCGFCRPAARAENIRRCNIENDPLWEYCAKLLDAEAAQLEGRTDR